MNARPPIALLLLACRCLAATDAAWPVTHPVTSFGGEETDLLERIEMLKGQDSPSLRQAYLTEPPGKYRRRDRFENAIRAAIGLSQAPGGEPYRELAEKACRAALGEHLDAPPEDLCGRVSGQGALDDANFAMRDACYQFALLYHVTQDTAYARRSAALLARFAEQVPHWLIFRDEKPFPQSAADTLNSGSPRGFWGTWMFLDIHNGVPLLHAYDLIHGSGAMQPTGALQSIEAMLVRHVDLQFHFGWKMFNCEPYQIDGILIFAKVLGRPEWVHRCAKRVKDLYKVGFCADGWWLEGTASYHKQVHYGLKGIIGRHLQGYTDPPDFVSAFDGTRFDGLDIAAALARPMARADATLFRLQQPNGVWQTVHETTYPHRAYGVPPISEARPYLFGSTGHAILGYGSERERMVQATLHFGGTHGHEHSDMLNLILWARNREMISETRYRQLDIKNTTREWHRAGAGHVTVVVDGHDNPTRWSTDLPKRTRQPTDDIPGVPDWYWRWRCYGVNMDNGKLRLFNADFPDVQVVEADGERGYGSRVPMDLYRRTIALVKIDETDCYVVDVFRVKGGQVHDYMLHSCLDLPHSAAFSVPLPDRREGTLHKYISDLHSTTTDDGWSATFTLDDGSAALKTFVLPQRGTEIIQGTAPAMRRQGVAPFVAVRQSDGESIFVAVHHPYVGEPLVQAVERVELAAEAEGAVGVRVTLPNRVDTILSTVDESPWPLRRTADGRLSAQGRFAHVAESENGPGWTYLVDGDFLAVGDRVVRGDVSHSGRLTGTLRVETGDAVDAFVTGQELPLGKALNGCTLMVDQAGALVQSFRISDISRQDAHTLIHSADEPGMTISPNLIKLEYFPCWGIQGEARFRIAGSALLRRDPQGVWSFRRSGNAAASVAGKAVGPKGP